MNIQPSLPGQRGLRAGAGFTLIELMIALAVMSILVAVAYPSYMDQVRKGRRADGQAVLLEATQFMERFATENLRYDQSRAGTAVALPAYLSKAPKDGGAKFYDIQLQSVAADTYTLRAVPAGTHSGDACGTMTVTQTGLKGAAKDSCWRR
jgi:type IV pilus assembly protein PilE